MSLHTDANGMVHDIFYGIANRSQADPAKVRLLMDRILVRDLGDEEQVGSIVIPDSARGQEQARMGVVVAVGPGDSHTEKDYGYDGEGSLRRHKKFSGERLPMECKVGDVVCYDHRRDLEFWFQGQRFFIVNETQSVFGIVEE